MLFNRNYKSTKTQEGNYMLELLKKRFRPPELPSREVQESRFGSSQHYSCVCLYRITNDELTVVMRFYQENFEGADSTDRPLLLKLPGGSNTTAAETPEQTIRRELRQSLLLDSIEGYTLIWEDALVAHKKYVFAKPCESLLDIKNCTRVEPGRDNSKTETLYQPQWWELQDALDYYKDLESQRINSTHKKALLKLVDYLRDRGELPSRYLE